MFCLLGVPWRISGLWVWLPVFVLSVATASAHGVIAEPVHGGIGLQVRYDTGEPMAFAGVKVFAPQTPEQPWLDGETDPEGRFVFIPAHAGTWRIVVDDGMGHAVTRDLSVDAEPIAFAEARLRAQGRLWPAIAGIGFIFGGFGLWTMFRRRP